MIIEETRVFISPPLSGITGQFGRVFMVHRRSEEKLLLRKIRAIIYSLSYNDQIMCETVSKVSRQDVLAFLNVAICVSDVPDVEKGEVLVDSRGRGSFQKGGEGRAF